MAQGSKKNRFSTKKSSTPGRSKGSNCHRSVLKNQYCFDNKWYKKHPDNYAEACAVVDKLNR
jgi:hypothetical protein